MLEKNTQNRQANELRIQAEKIFQGKTVPPPEDLSQTLHELQVHQIELELQNEELRRAQMELNDTRARYFDLYDLAPVGYCTLSEEGFILEANLTLASLMDTSRGMLIKQPISRFIFKDDQDVYYLHRKRLIETGEPQECELRILKNEKGLFWARMEANIANGEEDASVYRVVLSDITTRKLQEEERELTTRMTLLISSPDALRKCMSELTAALQSWSGCETVGIRLQDGEDYPYYETRGFPPEFVKEENCLCAYGSDGKIQRDGKGNPILECMCGNILCGRFDPGKPFFTAHGSFWSNNTTELLAGTFEDDRMARTRNRCNGEGYESVALLPLRTDQEVLGLLQFNDHQPNRFTPELITQLERVADSLAMALSRRMIKESLARLEWMLSRSASTRQVFPSANSFRNIGYGDLTALNQNGLISRTIKKTILQGIASEYLDLLDTSSAIYEKNGDYALGIVSSSWCRFLDAASRNLCNADDNTEALLSGKWLCHESCWTCCSQQAIAMGEPVDIECKGGMRIFAIPIFAGKEIIGVINFGYGDPPKDPEKLQKIADAYGLEYEELLQTANTYDSRPPFIIEMAKRRLQVSARLIGSLVEHKLAEEEAGKLEAQLRQAHKMESVGRLAGGVAHDFNNMLCVILGHTDLALNGMDPNQKLYSDLKEIQKAGERSAKLTRQLLAFARKQTVAPKVLDLNETVADMLNMIQRLIGENIQIDWQPGENVWPVKVDPSQIDQILANLCVNARDAISGTGTIVIKTGSCLFAEAFSLEDTESIPGEFIMLSVSDSGCGMDDELREHLFEPFFTTKEVGKGTGLGLATIYGIMKQNAGFINVNSSPGSGTTFTVFLPRHQGEAEEVLTDKTRDVAIQGDETVLVVEDEPAILDLITGLLKSRGYTVLTAISPGDAIRLAREHTGEIHLLVSDIIMPGMDGQLLAVNLLKLYPQLKLLFMSGYTADVITRQGILNKGVHFIQKPFSVDDLTDKVRDVLVRTPEKNPDDRRPGNMTG